jgi:hypothetical protein
MERDGEGVLVPRLRLGNVLLRGAMFGVVGAVALAMAMLFIGDHSERMDFLIGAGVLSFILGGQLVFGLWFWPLCRDDIRRVRDWRTIKSQFESVNVTAPVLVRLGTTGVVVLAASFGLYHLVDNAPYDSWLYAH